MTKDILFNNSNILYALHYEAVFDETIQVVPKQIAFNSKTEVESPISSPPILPPAGATMRPATSGPVDPRSGSPYEQQSFPPPPKVPHVFDIQLFDDFMTKNPKVRFVYVHWLDSMVTTRVRIVPIKEFTRMIHEGDRIGISQGNTGTLQDDTSTPGINTTEQTYIEPDLRSLRRTHSKDPLPSATVLSYLRSESGSPLSSCPRNNLEMLVNDLQYNHSTTLLIGFKMQVTFLARNSNSQGEAYSPLSKTRAWSTTTPEQWLQLPFLTESVLALDEMSIEMQQFSAESGHGQYEFILPPQPPVPAIDTLIQARQVISQIAALHGLRATLYPKPFDGLSTATHVHMSLNPPVRDMQFFVGGVVAHLPAISAFSMAESASYAPEAGMWVAWGTQTRDVPLRRAKEGIWEVRCLDGMANMYLALTAIVAAGLLGLQSAGVEAMHYSQLDVPVDPNRMDEAGRARFGVMRRMPATLEEALLALMKDSALVEALRHGAVRDYVGMKETEQRMLAGMGEVERRMFLIERY
jgi:glutamine synthetase